MNRLLLDFTATLRRWRDVAMKPAEAWHLIVVVIAKLVPYRSTARVSETLGTWLYLTLGRRHRAAISSYVTAVIGECEEQARSIALGSYRANIRFWADYGSLAYGRNSYVTRRLKEIAIPDHSVLDYLRSTDKPVLIAGLHMGRYLSGTIAMLEALQTDRSFLTFRQLAQSELEDLAYRHIRRRVTRLEVLRHDGRSAVKALLHLRRGGIVGTFVDLPPSFGPAHPVTLFRQKAALVSGPARLALVTNSIVAPMYIGLDDAGREILIYEPPFEAIREDGESEEEAIDRIMMCLAGFVERSVKCFPEQWLLWPMLPRYMA